MNTQDLDKLPPGYLVYYKPYPKNNPYIGPDHWYIGKPRIFDNKYWNGGYLCEWVCEVLAEKTRLNKEVTLQTPIYDGGELIPIPSQDIVKYINYITKAGEEYIKELTHESS